MSSITELFNQFVAVWSRLSISSRIGLGAVSAVLLALVVAVGIWSSRPQFVPLATGLAPTEAADIISRLEADGIEHKMNFAGTSVLVPKSEWNNARLVAGNAITSQPAAPEWNDNVLGDPTLNRYKIGRFREATLARTIARMDGIQNASVHIAQAEPSPFVRDQRPSTASVVVELKSGGTFTREQGAAIVTLVAGSVEGLEPDNVSVMDTKGRILSSSDSGIAADIAGQFEYRRRLESDLAAKANVMLAQMLGYGRALVRVSADVDFTLLTREETTFDPDIKVRTQEDILIEKTVGPSPQGSGAAGTSSNLGPQQVTLGNSATISETEKNNTTYETAKKVDTVTQAPGRIERLTVAVMADLGQIAEDQQTTPPSTRVTKEQIESLVKQAVGFDDQRGDQIEVLVTEMAGVQADDAELVRVQQWDFYNRLARSSSLGLAAVVALLIGVLTIRRLRPIVVSIPSQRGDGHKQQVVAELSQQLKSNPEAMKAIVSAWMSDTTEHAAEEYPRRAA